MVTTSREQQGKSERSPGKSIRGVLKDFRTAAAALLLSFVLAMPAHAQFEGVVQSKNITTDELGRPQEFIMTMWIKKDMVRIETKGSGTPASAMIYRTDLKKIWMLNEEEKSYFEISQDEKAQEMYASGGSGAKYSVRRTGKTKAIAGYQCEQFVIKRENEETELWGTKKLGHLLTTLSKALGSDQLTASEGAVSEVMKQGIYPLLSATKVDGHLIESQEVTRIEPQSLDAGLFSLPTDFKKQKTLDMFHPEIQEKRKQ